MSISTKDAICYGELRHDFVRGAAESVAMLCLVKLDDAIGLAFVALGTLAS